MRLIGLSGTMESGKDTVADVLVSRYGYYRVSVGELIRQELLNLNVTEFKVSKPIFIPNHISAVLHRPSKKALWEKPTPIPVRVLLQWYGQLRFQEDSRYWLNRIEQDVETCGHDRVVFSDVRMPNEFKYIKDKGGYVWRTVRVKDHNPLEATVSHLSEVALNNYPFDQYLANNGSVEDLVRLVCLLVNGYDLGDGPQRKLW